MLDDHVQVHGVGYTSFLIPGLVDDAGAQNAFANSSSSLIQAKITGSIVSCCCRRSPYSAFFAAYVLGRRFARFDGRFGGFAGDGLVSSI